LLGRLKSNGWTFDLPRFWVITGTRPDRPVPASVEARGPVEMGQWTYFL
jgi:hypothetical protein